MSHSDILQAAGFSAAELSGVTLAIHTPVDGSEIARLKTHDKDDVQAMIGRGVDAFKSWRSTPAPQRGELVRLIGEELRAEKETLGLYLTGHPITQYEQELAQKRATETLHEAKQQAAIGTHRLDNQRSGCVHEQEDLDT